MPTEHHNRLKAKLLISTKKSQVFVFIWTSSKLRGGITTHTTTLGGREREPMCVRETERELSLPGDLKVPVFPHFWELVIYSCWSHIKQDQRLLPDIFWTYWGNSNDYQRILPTNDDTGTILRESAYKTNTETQAGCTQRDTIKRFSRLFIVGIPLSSRRAPWDETFPSVIGTDGIELEPWRFPGALWRCCCYWFYIYKHTHYSISELRAAFLASPNQNIRKIRCQFWLSQGS